MTQGQNQMDQIAQQASEAGRENIEACIKAGTIFAKGFESLMRESMAMAQDTAEKQTQFVKQALSVKTLNEWTDIQNKLAQSNFDQFVSNATKISEMSAKLLNDSCEPLQNQAAKGLKKAANSAKAA